MPDLTYILSVKDDGSAVVENFNKKVQDSGGETTKAGGKMTAAFSRVATSLKALPGMVFNLKNAIIGAGVGMLVKNFMEAAGASEKLANRMFFLRGSTASASAAMAVIKKTAEEVHMPIEQIAQAAAALETFGVKTEDGIKAVADLAAVMGIDATEAASALGRAWVAGAGGAEMLRNKGVLAMVQMKTGIQDLSKLTLPEFRQALMSTLSDTAGPIAGAAAMMGGTWSATVNDMKNAWTEAKVGIVNAGLGEFIKGVVDGITIGIRAIQEAVSGLDFMPAVDGMTVTRKTSALLVDAFFFVARVVLGLGVVWHTAKMVFWGFAEAVNFIIYGIIRAFVNFKAAIAIVGEYFVKAWYRIKEVALNVAKKFVETLSWMVGAAGKVVPGMKGMKESLDAAVASLAASANEAVDLRGEVDLLSPVVAQAAANDEAWALKKKILESAMQSERAEMDKGLYAIESLNAAQEAARENADAGTDALKRNRDAQAAVRVEKEKSMIQMREEQTAFKVQQEGRRESLRLYFEDLKAIQWKMPSPITAEDWARTVSVFNQYRSEFEELPVDVAGSIAKTVSELDGGLRDQLSLFVRMLLEYRAQTAAELARQEGLASEFAGVAGEMAQGLSAQIKFDIPPILSETDVQEFRDAMAEIKADWNTLPTSAREAAKQATEAITTGLKDQTDKMKTFVKDAAEFQRSTIAPAQDITNRFREMSRGFQATNMAEIGSYLEGWQTKIDKAKEYGEQEQMTREAQLNSGLFMTTAVFGQITELTKAFGSENLALTKAFGIAQAVVNTAIGITAALKLGPWGIPLAAVIAAMGAAQIAAIVAAKPGGGTAPATGGGAGGMGMVGTEGVSAAPAEPARVREGVNVSISVSGFVGSEAELASRLGKVIREAVGDGVDFGLAASR